MESLHFSPYRKSIDDMFMQLLFMMSFILLIDNSRRDDIASELILIFFPMRIALLIEISDNPSKFSRNFLSFSDEKHREDM